MKIQTSYAPPPIPSRAYDWTAVDPDSYDGAPDSSPRASAIGMGASEAEAIADLLERIRDLGSEAYNLGCDARNDFAARVAPAEMTWTEQGQWLEGWDDTNSGFKAESED